MTLLINHIDSAAYEVISEFRSFEEAINELQKVYAMVSNSIFARYLLQTCLQQSGQSLDEYFQKLKTLSMACNFAAVSAIQHKEEAVRDAFISGLALPDIHQQILENPHLDFQATLAMARSLEASRNNSLQFDNVIPTSSESCTKSVKSAKESPRTDAAVALRHRKCQYYGNTYHARRFCPAKEVQCFRCLKVAHFAKVCRSCHSPVKNTSATLMSINETQKIEEANKRVNVPVTINGRTANALIDTESTLTHISENLSKLLKLKLSESSQKITLAASDSYSKSLGMCQVNLKGQEYKCVSVTLLKNQITDVIFGRNFMTQHQSINIHFGGVKPTLQLVALEAVKTSTPAKLFQYLHNDCRPIATKE